MFHKLCDEQGPTVTFVQSEEYNKVFGGYTQVSWNSSDAGIYKEDPEAFIFSLTNETLHPIKPSFNTKAVWHHSEYLSSFGSYDFFIVDNCFKKQITDLALGHSYQLGEEVIGNWVGLNRTHLAGARDFYVKEIEVYKVIISQ